MARKIPAEVIKAARSEYQVTDAPPEELRPICLGKRVVGFYRPRMTHRGRSLGPIFVLPEYRRRGLALAVYRKEQGPLIACVRDDNPASAALHRRAGFHRWFRYAAGWWWKRP